GWFRKVTLRTSGKPASRTTKEPRAVRSGAPSLRSCRAVHALPDVASRRGERRGLPGTPSSPPGRASRGCGSRVDGAGRGQERLDLLTSRGCLAPGGAPWGGAVAAAGPRAGFWFVTVALATMS